MGADWKMYIRRVAPIARTASNKTSIERLLAGHAAERSAFEANHELPVPRETSRHLIEAIATPDGARLRVKNLCTTRPLIAPDLVHARRRMVERHKMEIIALDNGCTCAFRELQTIRAADVARKRSVIQALTRETCHIEEKPHPAAVKPGRVIRLSLWRLRRSI
jgi:hypothetical protein